MTHDAMAPAQQVRLLRAVAETAEEKASRMQGALDQASLAARGTQSLAAAHRPHCRPGHSAKSLSAGASIWTSRSSR